jgi:hypothetical protein
VGGSSSAAAGLSLGVSVFASPKQAIEGVVPLDRHASFVGTARLSVPEGGPPIVQALDRSRSLHGLLCPYSRISPKVILVG